MKNFFLLILFFCAVLNCYSQTTKEYLKNAKAKEALQDYKGAIIEYNKAIKLNPKDTLAYYKRGLAKLSLKDNKSAIEDLSKVIELNPKHSMAYYYRGVLKSNTQDLNGAILDFNMAIEINPSSAMAYYSRGTSKIILKQNGCSDLKKAAELGYEDKALIKKYCN